MSTFTQRQWNWLFASVLILGSLFIVATRVRPQQTTATTVVASDGVMAPAPLADHPAPDFTLSSLAGTKVALSDLKGQVLLINVWATWCPPCRSEMPTIQAAYEQYHDQGFTVVAVNFQEDPSAVAMFMSEHQLTFPALLDEDRQVSRAYQAVSLPSSFLALRVSDFAWPGALLGGLLVGSVWCRGKGFDVLKLADSAALTLPLVHAIASVGLLLSGEAFGVPTSLPWAVPLFGAMRHPTQIYLALAALSSLLVVWRLSRRTLPEGALAVVYLGLQGLW